MHGDASDEFTERRLSAKIIEGMFSDLDERMTAVEHSVTTFPKIVEDKLQEQADKLRKSADARRDFALRVITALAALAGPIIAAIALSHK